MPPRSAAMLTTLAITSSAQALHRTQRGYRTRITPASPSPVTMPRRAHMICMAAINGNEKIAVHRGAYPNAAPVTEYVEMPDGSSSAAPVINPGPRFEKNLRKRPCRTNARRAALAPGEFWLNAGTAVLRRRGTNLLPVIPLDSPCHAKVCKRVRRFLVGWLRPPRRYGHARSGIPDSALVVAGKLDWSAPAPAWSFHVRSGDLLFRGARRRYDGHVRHRHGARQQSVGIRACDFSCTLGAVFPAPATISVRRAVHGSANLALQSAVFASPALTFC